MVVLRQKSGHDANPWILFFAKLEHSLAIVLARIAYWCAKHPKRVIAASVFVIAVLGCGLFTAVQEFRTEKVWVDPRSIPMKDRAFVDEYFVASPRVSTVIIAARKPEEKPNVLTKAAMAQVFQLYDKYLAIEADGRNILEETCIRVGTPNEQGPCIISGVTNFWFGSSALFNLTALDDEDVGSTCAQERYPVGIEVLRQSDFGDFELDGNIATARAVRLTFLLEGEFEGGYDVQVEWEREFTRLSLEEYSEIVAYPQSFSSLDDEINSNLGNDIILMGLAYMLMMTFAAQTLGKPFSKVHGRVTLANQGVFLVMGSMLAGYGLAAYMGILFTPLVQILPFILVGIGIDDAYVITQAFDNTNREHGIEERIRDALLRCGVSITLTSLTDISAFALGSFTRLPAIEYFCQYAALAIVFIYVAHLTTYPALLAIDAKRQAEHRLDLVPCVVSKSSKLKMEAEQENTKRDRTPNQDGDSESELGSLGHHSLFGKFFGEYYTPFLMKNEVRGFVLLFFAGLCGVSVWQATKLTTEFQVDALLPDGSYLKDSFAQSEQFESRMPASFVFAKLEYQREEVQDIIFEAVEDVVTIDTVESVGPFWLSEFTAWAIAQPEYNSTEYLNEARTHVVGENFVPLLQEFLLQPQMEGRFGSNIVFRNDTNENEFIAASRVDIYHRVLVGSADLVSALVDTQEYTAELELDPKPFIFSFNYLFFDQIRIIVPEMVQNFSLCLAAVTFICTFVLVHPVAVLSIVVVMLMIFASLLGSLPLWGLDLNSISGVNLVLAIGLVVDYTCHIFHKFSQQDARLSRKERVIVAMREIGPAVFLGISTTFLGILPLAFTTSDVFRVFFKMMFSIVVTGALHGLVLVPVVLSLVGPALPEFEDVTAAVDVHRESKSSLQVHPNDVEKMQAEASEESEQQ